MKKKLIAVYIFLIIALLCNCVYAAFDGEFQLRYSADTVKAGETVNVTLNVKNITGTDKGVESIEGYINVDENIIEPLAVDCIETNEDGKVVVGNMALELQDLTNANENTELIENGVTFNGKLLTNNDAKILIDLPKPIKEDTSILTINFKIKIVEVKKCRKSLLHFVL